MASQAKRARPLFDPRPLTPDPGGDPGDDPDPLPAFLRWGRRVGLQLSPKVTVSRVGTVSGYGMLALEDLQRGELLFSVPRAVLLSQHTTSIRALLHAERQALKSQSGWVPLLLALLHEYQASDSPWHPYFSLWPDLNDLDHPMFWPEEERGRLLRGTGVPEAVEKDLANISREYSSIVLPFVEAHPDLFPASSCSLRLYCRLVALVMAYSFQEPLEEEEEEEKEPNPPMMVPAADLLNHVANHNANLEYGPECLRMVATQPIPKGQEIFNTYGQMANWQLLHMYGFAEPYPGNTDDTADIQMVTVRAAALQGAETEAEKQSVRERWDLLCRLEMVGEEGAFVVGWEEVLTEEELSATLKVLCMPAEEFREFKEHEGREEDDGEDDGLNLTTETIPKLRASWRKLLRDSALLTLRSYATDLKTEQELLDNAAAYARLGPRERQAFQVRYGQKMILHRLLELTS
ncbi:N-lysine methyltransferase SETD6 [Tachyglossus aculeatus]|uniref:N-lysine methyltransferase SETD6 n=1 Tax=Tachyglossus aculeatus TaxID=9261 RepID=UPI0018F702C7|nr:N-lysine methyltransferase SETD6 [Tachyglossus aculeatus]